MWSDQHLFHWLIELGAFSTRWLRLSVNFWPRSILRGEIMPWMWWFYKYQVLSSELFHHFPFVLLLLPSDVLQIFLSANSGTPENWLFVDVCSEWGKDFKDHIALNINLASSIMIEENLLFSILRSSKSSSRYFRLSYLYIDVWCTLGWKITCPH